MYQYIVFTAGYKAVIHSHTIAEEAQVEKILWKHDPETGKPIKETCTFARMGDTITVRISVPQTIAIEPFEACPQLGRITLRDQGKSIAIGKVKKLE
jgi:peptide chain release factor subunit 3